MNNTPFKTDALLFDVDGTLWDSSEQVAETWKQACAEAGLPSEHITASGLTKEFGKLMTDIAISLFPTANEEQRAILLETCCTRENEDLLKNPPALYPGVRELFDILKARKIPIIIISNCQAGYIEVLIESHHLESYVAGHLCPGDTGMKKADNIRLTVSRFNLKSPVYIGDTTGDEEAAADAGIPFIHAAYGFGTAQNPDYTVQKPLDIASLPIF